MKVLLGALLVAVVGLAPSALAADATRMAGVDAQHLNAVPDSPLRPPLRIRWSVDATRVPWQVLVDGGRVLTLEQVPGEDGHIVARDVADGHELWSRGYTFHGGDTQSFAADAGRVFVSNALWDTNVLRVEALDAASGALQWSRELPANQGGASGPTPDNGVVYLLAGASPTTAYALRQSDGSTIWQTPDLAGGDSGPAVDASRVYLSLGGGQSYALDRATGAIQWHYDTGITGGGGIDPVLWGGRLYGEDGLVLDPGSGSKIATWTTHSLSIAGDVGVERVEDGVRAFGPAYETTRWKMPHHVHFIVGDHVYGGDFSGGGQIFSLRLRDGTPDWCYVLTGPQISGYERGTAPVAAGDGVLIATAGTQIAAFENGGTGSSGCVATSTGTTSQPQGDLAYPPPTDGPGIALKLGRRLLLLGERTNLTGRVSGVPLRPTSRVVVELDDFPYSDRGFKRQASSPVNADGTFAFKITPGRNTRLRVRLVGSKLVSAPLELLADFPFRTRVLHRRGRHPRVRYTVYAFPGEDGVRHKMVHAYLTRGTNAPWRRVDRRHPARRTRRSVTWVLRYPRGRLGRHDHWMVCWREPKPDGYGPRLEIDRRCGARTLPRDLFA